MIWKSLILLRWSYGRDVPCGQEGVRSGVWVDGEWRWGGTVVPICILKVSFIPVGQQLASRFIKTQAGGGEKGRERMLLLELRI